MKFQWNSVKFSKNSNSNKICKNLLSLLKLSENCITFCKMSVKVLKIREIWNGAKENARMFVLLFICSGISLKALRAKKEKM